MSQPDLDAVARASALLDHEKVDPAVACVKNYRDGVALETPTGLPRCAWGIKNCCGCGAPETEAGGDGIKP